MSLVVEAAGIDFIQKLKRGEFSDCLTCNRGFELYYKKKAMYATRVISLG